MSKGWLYSQDEPEGKVFEGEAYTLKVKEGWVDTPALIGQEPPKNKGGRPPKVKP